MDKTVDQGRDGKKLAAGDVVPIPAKLAHQMKLDPDKGRIGLLLPE